MQRGLAHLRVLYKRQSLSLPLGGDDPDETGDPSTPTNTRTSASRTLPSSNPLTQSSTTEVTSISTTRSVPPPVSTSERDLSSSPRSSSTSLETSSTAEETTSLSVSQRTSAVVSGGSTSFVTNIITIGPPSTSASSAPNNSSGADHGPSAGMVVGVVAGSLVGIVVIAGLLGYFFKTKFGKDKDDGIDDAVFNKNDFRHESVLLQDDDIDRYSMRSGSAAGSLNVAGVGRTIPGLQRNNTADPRPPSTFERHVYNASPVHPTFAPMPSFQPGQIVNTNFYQPPQQQYAASEGGWGVAASYATGNNHLALGAHLERQASVGSHYADEPARAPAQQQQAYDYGGAQYRAGHDYPPHTAAGGGRPASPVEQQQVYAGSPKARAPAQRQLSVRNRDSADAYDGMGF